MKQKKLDKYNLHVKKLKTLQKAQSKSTQFLAKYKKYIG